MPPRNAGADNPRWKGGVKITSKGYRLLKRPDHPYATKDGYVAEHRLVVEQRIGRFLAPTEDVHHINGDRLSEAGV